MDQGAYTRALEELRTGAGLQDARVRRCCDQLAAADHRLSVAFDAIIAEARVAALASEERWRHEEGRRLYERVRSHGEQEAVSDAKHFAGILAA